MRIPPIERTTPLKTHVPMLYIALAFALSACATSTTTPETRTAASNGAAAGSEIGNMDHMASQEHDFQQRLARVDGVSIERQMNTISITFRTDFLFDVNSVRLNPTGYNEIYHVAEVLNRYRNTVVRVNGHTDAAGAEKYNLELSERRACAVMDALVNAGVAPSRIMAQGFGKTCPVASNATEEGKRLNRRVTLDVITPGSEPGSGAIPSPFSLSHRTGCASSPFSLHG